MTLAVVLAPVALPLPLFFVACLFTLIGLWAVANTKGRRLIGALLVAVVLIGPAVVRASEEEDDFIIRNKCASLTIWDVEYWYLGCEFLP